MRYTERGREMQMRRKRKIIYFLSSISPILIGCIVIAAIFGLLTKSFFNSRLNLTNNQHNQVLNTGAQSDNKTNASNNGTYNKFLTGGSKVIFEPIHQYTNDYILKELKDNAIKNQNRIKQQNNNKFAYINSDNGKSLNNWEECPPYKRNGYDYSNAVILCKEDKVIILPIRND